MNNNVNKPMPELKLDMMRKKIGARASQWGDRHKSKIQRQSENKSPDIKLESDNQD